MTNELPLVHRALTKRNVPVITLQTVSGFDGETATLSQLFTGETTQVQCRNLVIVGMRAPNDDLFNALTERAEDVLAAGIGSVEKIGDALAPGAITHAVHSGHRYAKELGLKPQGFRRDAPIVEFEPSFTSEAGLVKAI
jgi:dimethylamine/trimethylamine dehydrogenase